jgi:hypothetical protein
MKASLAFDLYESFVGFRLLPTSLVSIFWSSPLLYPPTLQPRPSDPGADNFVHFRQELVKNPSQVSKQSNWVLNSPPPPPIFGFWLDCVLLT